MMVYSRQNNFIKYIRENRLTVKTPQICANMRIVAEKTTNRNTHLSSK
jgi:hypothetical protein